MQPNRTGYYSVLLVLFGLVAYSNTFQVPFIFDDLSGLVEKIPELFRQEGSWGFTILEQSRPFLLLTFALQYLAHGLEVWPFHLVNLAIHLANGLLLFKIARLTLQRPRTGQRTAEEARFLAFFISLLWLLHPLGTQSVTYLSQRAESLASLFCLSTLLCVIQSATGNHKRASLWSALAILSCLLGMATKEAFLVTPIAILGYDRIFLATSFRGMLKKRLGLYLGLFASWAFLAKAALFTFLTSEQTRALGDFSEFGSTGKTAGLSMPHITSWEYARTQPGVILHYMKTAFWPTQLCFDYVWPIASTLKSVGPQMLGIFFLLTLTGLSLVRFAPLGFLGLWFFIQLAPRSSFIPNSALAAEHRMYLPLIALTSLVVLGLFQLEKKLSWTRRAIGPDALCGALAFSLGVLTFQRNTTYARAESIWRDTAQKQPHSFRAWNNLGDAILKQGRREAAEAHFRKALEINPDYFKANNNLAAALIHMNRPNEALEYLTKVVATEEGNIKPVYFNLALAYQLKGDRTSSVTYYEKAIDLSRPDPHVVNNLGRLYAEQGRKEEAEVLYRKGLEVSPGDPTIEANLKELLVQLHA